MTPVPQAAGSHTEARGASPPKESFPSDSVPSSRRTAVALSLWAIGGLLKFVLTTVALLAVLVVAIAAWHSAHNGGLSGVYDSEDGSSNLTFWSNGTYRLTSVGDPIQGQYQVDGHTINMLKQFDSQMRTDPSSSQEQRIESLIYNQAGASFKEASLSNDSQTVVWMGEAYHRVGDAQAVPPIMSVSDTTPGTDKIPTNEATSPVGGGQSTTSPPRLGIGMEPLQPQNGAPYGVPAGDGVYVKTVVPGSAAATANIQPGDYISQVDGQWVTDTGSINRAEAVHGSGDHILLRVLRGGQKYDISVPLGD